MHTCYYNEKGLLVSHPRFTTQNYLSKSFIIDFLSILPGPKLLGIIVGRKKSGTVSIEKVRNFLRLSKLLPLYRVSGAFFYFERDILKPKKVLV